MDIEKFKKTPIMGILRGIDKESLKPLIEASVLAGLETLEITMNTLGAPALIKEAIIISKGRLTIGAGTVLDYDNLKRAIDAGASFIVSPVLVKDVATYCTVNKIPFFPGALTPQEIYVCWNEGAAMVKVFPAKFFGPSYFKEIKAPLSGIKLLACGGVTPENIKDYFANGADAAAFGSSVFKREWLANKDFQSIANAIKMYINHFSKLYVSPHENLLDEKPNQRLNKAEA